VLQWGVRPPSPGASWWACLAGGAGLTSAGACWELKNHVKRSHQHPSVHKQTGSWRSPKRSCVVLNAIYKTGLQRRQLTINLWIKKKKR